MGTKSHWKQNGLYFKSGAVGDESVADTTAASTAVDNYGVTLLRSTANATYALNAPLLGSRKTVIFGDSTYVQKLKFTGASVNEDGTHDVLAVTLDTNQSPVGFAVDLYGASTAKWYMATADFGSSQVALTLTSAT